MDLIIPAAIVGFREGLESFLIVAIALRLFGRSGNTKSQRYVWLGTATGIIFSVAFGGLLFLLAGMIGGAGITAKLWEAGASLAALVLVTTFIVWMIGHGSRIAGAVEVRLGKGAGTWGVILVVSTLIFREGVEVSLFAFAGTYPIAGIALGLAAALVLVWAVFTALVRVNLAAIFNLTLGYLVLQAGFLLGYGIHEGLSAAKEAGLLEASSPLLFKAFDLSATILDHKTGVLGIPLSVLAGWYSRPEWIQVAAQYLYTIAVFAYWAFATRTKMADRAAL